MNTYDSTAGIAAPAYYTEALRPREPAVSWGAIFAGAVIATGLMILFTLIGAALGAAAFDPQSDPNPVGGMAVGSTAFTVASQLTALAAGGYVAARLAGNLKAVSRMLHGASVWAIATIAAVYFATTAVASIAGGAVSAVSNASQAAATTVAAVIPDDVSADELLPDQMPPRLREALEQQGLTRSNLMDELTGVARNVVSAEELDEAQTAVQQTREAITSSPAGAARELNQLVDKLFGGSEAVISQEDVSALQTEVQSRLGISEGEAQALITEAQEMATTATQEVEAAMQAARTEALQMAEQSSEAVSSAAWAAAAASLLGLLAACAGSAAARRSRETTVEESESA